MRGHLLATENLINFVKVFHALSLFSYYYRIGNIMLEIIIIRISIIIIVIIIIFLIFYFQIAKVFPCSLF